jgi:hypothetical protein
MKAHAYFDRKADSDLEAIMALVAVMFNLKEKLDLSILSWEENCVIDQVYRHAIAQNRTIFHVWTMAIT